MRRRGEWTVAAFTKALKTNAVNDGVTVKRVRNGEITVATAQCAQVFTIEYDTCRTRSH